MLSGKVVAFFEELYYVELRFSVIRRLAVGYGSPFGAFQISQNTIIQKQNEREVGLMLVQEKEHSDLKALFFRELERPASALLAEYNSDSETSRLNNPSHLQRSNINAQE